MATLQETKGILADWRAVKDNSHIPEFDVARGFGRPLRERVELFDPDVLHGAKGQEEMRSAWMGRALELAIDSRLQLAVFKAAHSPSPIDKLPASEAIAAIPILAQVRAEFESTRQWNPDAAVAFAYAYGHFVDSLSEDTPGTMMRSGEFARKSLSAAPRKAFAKAANSDGGPLWRASFDSGFHGYAHGPTQPWPKLGELEDEATLALHQMRAPARASGGRLTPRGGVAGHGTELMEILVLAGDPDLARCKAAFSGSVIAFDSEWLISKLAEAPANTEWTWATQLDPFAPSFLLEVAALANMGLSTQMEDAGSQTGRFDMRRSQMIGLFLTSTIPNYDDFRKGQPELMARVLERAGILDRRDERDDKSRFAAARERAYAAVDDPDDQKRLRREGTPRPVTERSRAREARPEGVDLAGYRSARAEPASAEEPATASPLGSSPR